MRAPLFIALAFAFAALPSSAVEPWPELGQVTLALHSTKVTERRAAVDALEPYGTAEVEALLRGALRDDDVAVRRLAITALGRRHCRVEDELRALLVDADASIRVAAATALAGVPVDDAAKTGVALERSLGDADAAVRRAAVATLAARPELGMHAQAALVGRLDDAQPEVRRQAASALGRLHVATAVIPLIGRVGDGSREVRVAAAAALAQLGDERAQPAVLRLLDDSVDEVRVAAARALGTLGAAPAVPVLGELLHSHSASEALRAHAAFSLARIAARAGPASTAALLLLSDALTQPELAELAGEALRAVGRAAVPLAITQLDGTVDTDTAARWTQLLGGSGDLRAGAALVREVERARLPATVLASAVAALSSALPTIPTLEPSLRAFVHSPDATVRRSAAMGLLRECGVRCTDVWLSASNDADPDVRRTALAGLALGPAESTHARLEGLVAAPDLPTTLAAIDALAQLGDHRALAALASALLDGRQPARRHAVAALTQLADHALTAELIHRLRTLPTGDDRLVENIRLLGLLDRGQNDAVARDLLLALAERQSGHTSVASAYEAVDALAALGDRAALGRLRALLRRDDAVLRLRVIAALAALAPSSDGERDALVRLIANRLDTDVDPRVRAEAAWALGVAAVSGSAAALDALTRARGGAENVRINVAAALVRLGRGDLTTPLAHDDDGAVRANAAAHSPPSSTDYLLVDLSDFDSTALVDQTVRLHLPGGLCKAAFVDGRGTVRQERVPSGTASVELDGSTSTRVPRSSL